MISTQKISFGVIRPLLRSSVVLGLRSPIISNVRTVSHRFGLAPRSIPLIGNRCDVRTTCRPTSITIDDASISDSVKQMTERLFSGDRRSLAQAITLLESTNPERRREGQYILDRCMNYLNDQEMKTGKYSIRIGLSGPPGAGKSTFIEALGSRLTGTIPWLTTRRVVSGKSQSAEKSEKPVFVPQGTHRVAVLAVDPSSSTTGGSLLADKTRMYELSRDFNAYVRPSPSGGNLGGVARSTNEAVLLCEAAGYDVVLVETVGVGQSEFAVADMVDIFVLIIPPAGGDELQGIKRGIVEVADIVLVNKSDGDLIPAARRIALEYTSALKYQRKRRSNWVTPVMLASSYEGTGIPEFWKAVCEFKNGQIGISHFQQNRRKQLKVWMRNYVREGIWDLFKQHKKIRDTLPEMEEKVTNGELAPGPAAEILLELFSKQS